jgi:hypothetical protein
MKIKRLCIANGDEYEDVTIALDVDDLKIALLGGDLITIEVDGKEVLLNTEFIVSFEVEESRGLSVI